MFAVSLVAPAALLLAAFAPPADGPTAAPAPTGPPAVPVSTAVMSEPVGVVTISSRPVPAAPAEPVWQKDLKSAFALAAKSDKPVLVLFGADWCHYCHKQDDETLTDAAVKKALANGFIPVRLDMDADEKVAEVLEVTTLPQAVILSPNADLLLRAKGYHKPAQFTAALTKATAKHDALRAARVAAAPADSATF